MKRTLKFIIQACLMAVTLSACICEDYEPMEEPEAPLIRGLQMGFTIHVGGNKPATRGAGDNVEEGNARENMIDIENRDFRVYIFNTTANDGYIGELEIISVLDVTDDSADDYKNDYYVVGRVNDEDAYLLNEGFRLVVMANLSKWYKFNGFYDNKDNAIYGGYPREDTDKDGKTDVRIGINGSSIKRDNEGNGDGVYFYGKNAKKEEGVYQLYEDEDAGFNVNTDERLIPMWGIHTYKDVTLERNTITNLDAPLTMLRTMAKIEVIIDEKLELGNNTVKDVYLKGYKSHAMIEPYNASYQDNDYNTNENFDAPNPYWGSTNNRLKMSLYDNKYIVYIPEINSNGDYWGNNISYNDCEIQIKLKDIGNPFTFKLGAYDNQGNHTPIDILRNHIYRYTIQDIAVNPQIYYQVVEWGRDTINIEFR